MADYTTGLRGFAWGTSGLVVAGFDYEARELGAGSRSGSGRAWGSSPRTSPGIRVFVSLGGFFACLPSLFALSP